MWRLIIIFYCLDVIKIIIFFIIAILFIVLLPERMVHVWYNLADHGYPYYQNSKSAIHQRPCFVTVEPVYAGSSNSYAAYWFYCNCKAFRSARNDPVLCNMARCSHARIHYTCTDTEAYLHQEEPWVGMSIRSIWIRDAAHYGLHHSFKGYIVLYVTIWSLRYILGLTKID